MMNGMNMMSAATFAVQSLQASNAPCEQLGVLHAQIYTDVTREFKQTVQQSHKL